MSTSLYSFELTALDPYAMLPQTSRALEMRTELNSRAQFPRMWKLIDRLRGSRPVSEEQKRLRARIWSLVCIVLGIVLSAKFTAFAMKKNARFTLSALLGLVAASAVSIVFINMQKMTADVGMIVGSVVAFALGGAIVFGLGKITTD